jgi:tetratricopeptide (TPR) repeat protein
LGTTRPRSRRTSRPRPAPRRASPTTWSSCIVSWQSRTRTRSRSDRYARSDAELLLIQGEIHQKLGDKTKALASYQKALDRARRNPTVLGQLATKLKELGRKDLATKATVKQGEQLASEAAEQKARQEQFQKMIAEQMKQQAQEKAAGDGAKTPPITISPGQGTSGKPISIKLGGGDTKKPAAKETTPAKP